MPCLQDSGMVWRTNPNCPVALAQGSKVLNAFSALSAEAVRKEVRFGQVVDVS